MHNSEILQIKYWGVGLSKGSSALGLDKIFKQPEAITTSFKDVNRNGQQMPEFPKQGAQPTPLTSLKKAPQHGYVLEEGYYEITNKSYCLMAGTFAPSHGDGYMYAPTLGNKKNIVISILRNAESHPEIKQHDIQILLWAIIARTRFADFSTDIKLTASQLLSPQQLLHLEGGTLGFLPANTIEKAKEKLPTELQSVFDAQNKIRGLIKSGNYTFQDMEKMAIRAGMAAPVSDTPSGIWTLHPDGYYIRYYPNGYSTTVTQIYVPKDLPRNKEIIYDATDDIAVPANVNAQRLAQTNEKISNS